MRIVSIMSWKQNNKNRSQENNLIIQNINRAKSRRSNLKQHPPFPKLNLTILHICPLILRSFHNTRTRIRGFGFQGMSVKMGNFWDSKNAYFDTVNFLDLLIIKDDKREEHVTISDIIFFLSTPRICYILGVPEKLNDYVFLWTPCRYINIYL